MNYAEHIESICLANEITVGNHTTGGRAWRKSRHMNIRPVKSAITYAMALHEIGHILGPRQNGVRLEKELGAWEWAKENAFEWSDTMNKKCQTCLQSYIVWALRSKKAKRLSGDHPIYAMAYS